MFPGQGGVRAAEAGSKRAEKRRAGPPGRARLRTGDCEPL